MKTQLFVVMGIVGLCLSIAAPRVVHAQEGKTFRGTDQKSDEAKREEVEGSAREDQASSKCPECGYTRLSGEAGGGNRLDTQFREAAARGVEKLKASGEDVSQYEKALQASYRVSRCPMDQTSRLGGVKVNGKVSTSPGVSGPETLYCISEWSADPAVQENTALQLVRLHVKRDAHGASVKASPKKRKDLEEYVIDPNVVGMPPKKAGSSN